MKQSCCMSHRWGSHVAHMNESYRTYEWVMPHIRRSQFTPVKDSCPYQLGRFQSMRESCILGFVNFYLRFLASDYSFIPGQSQKPKVQIFRSGNQINPDRNVGMILRVPGTYEQLPANYQEHPPQEHPPWKGHKARFICTGKSMMYSGKTVCTRPEDYFCME